MSAAGERSDMISRMSFLGIYHDEGHTNLDFYAWDKAHKDTFEDRLAAAIAGGGTPETIELDTDRRILTQYFNTHMPLIAAALQLKPVTEESDHHLFIPTPSKDHVFMYFGAMTASMVHVACWIVVPKGAWEAATSAAAVKVPNPRICFWLLNTSYAQQLAGLGVAINIDALEKVLDLTQGLEYS